MLQCNHKLYDFFQCNMKYFFRILLGAILVITIFLFSSQASSADSNSSKVNNVLNDLKKSGRYQFDFPTRKSSGSSTGSESAQTRSRTSPWGQNEKKDEPGRGTQSDTVIQPETEKPVRKPEQSLEKTEKAPEAKATPPKQTPDRPASQSEGSKVSSGEVTPIWQFILWIVIGVAVAYILFPILSRFSYPKRSNDKSVEESDGRAIGARTEEGARQAYISDAEQRAQNLASQGNFTDAVHYLWLEILQDLQSKGINNISPADTGSDIIRNLQSNTILAEGAGTILRIVELSWVGGRDIEEQQYRECYNAYSQLKQNMKVDAPA